MSQLTYRLFDKEKPIAKQICYLICENENGYLWQSIATYIPPLQVPADDFCDLELWHESDFDKDKDGNCFTPQGFYEGSFYNEETHWKIPDKVVAWAPAFTKEEKTAIIKSLQQ
jgi:hypothetical protein